MQTVTIPEAEYRALLTAAKFVAGFEDYLDYIDESGIVELSRRVAYDMRHALLALDRATSAAEIRGPLVSL